MAARKHHQRRESDVRDTLTEPEFWLAWNGKPDGKPVVRHLNETDAQAEAMRLAQLHPGTTFFVMHPVTAYRAEIEIKPVLIGLKRKSDAS
jgi:hypothetical protein